MSRGLSGMQQPSRALVRALTRLMQVGGPCSPYLDANGEDAGDYFKGHVDALSYTEGPHTAGRLYELARQAGFVPTLGRTEVVARGIDDRSIE